MKQHIGKSCTNIHNICCECIQSRKCTSIMILNRYERIAYRENLLMIIETYNKVNYEK